jgi:hypothetical protein
MGYRSEVKAVVYPTNRQQNKDKYEQLRFLMGTTFKDVFDEWSNHFRWNDKQYVLVFEAEDVKWYETYPEVQRIEAFLDEVRDLEYETEFVRVGEEEGDIETNYSGDSEFMLGARTYISCDV